ncbi:hypothetical protein FJZ22_03440 [Candidatus Pacearchaeota archaeon]|nr:hypothetical protein [Candidatus Pacearchaeota archaeon]
MSSRLVRTIDACSLPVMDGLLCAFGQWYLAAGHDDGPLYAASAGMIGFGIALGRDFDRVFESFYS